MLFPAILLAASIAGTAFALPSQPALVRRVDTNYANFIIDESCKDENLVTVKEAIDGAHAMALEAMNISSTTKIYKTWMDSTSNAARHTVVVNRFQEIADQTDTTKDIVRKVTIECDVDKKKQGCIDGATAAADSLRLGDDFASDNGGVIYVCPKFLENTFSPSEALFECEYRNSSTDNISKDLATYRNTGNALIHELSHLQWFLSPPIGGTKDCLYGAASVTKFAKTSPWIAMYNADNYSYLALAAWLRLQPSCNRRMIPWSNGQNVAGLASTLKQCKADGSKLPAALKRLHVVTSTPTPVPPPSRPSTPSGPSPPSSPMPGPMPAPSPPSSPMPGPMPAPSP